MTKFLPAITIVVLVAASLSACAASPVGWRLEDTSPSTLADGRADGGIVSGAFGPALVRSGDEVAHPICVKGYRPTISAGVFQAPVGPHYRDFAARVEDLGSRWIVWVDVHTSKGAVVANPNTAALLVGTGCASREAHLHLIAQ